MKYRDLIKLLEPVADEEIDILVDKEEYYANMDDGCDETKHVDVIIKFFHSLEDNNDLIGTLTQTYDKNTFENITECEVEKYINI